MSTLEEKISTGLLRAIMQMPAPMPRILMTALSREVPELLPEIEKLCQRQFPWLQLNQARRTTMTGETANGPRFSAVWLAGETDSGDYLVWPHGFPLDNLPHHDLQLLEISLKDWLDIVQRRLRSGPKPQARSTAPAPSVKEKKSSLIEVDL